jgi:RNA polymerase primary sigma factor
MKDSATVFLNEAARIPLLTCDEEILLARRVQAMISLQEEDREAPYSKAERMVIKRGQRAKDRMVAANIRLVASIARRYHGAGRKTALQLDLEDLMQEGMLGLIRAAEKFDPERGYKFSTYAYWWIKQSMFRAITSMGRLIKVPHHIAEKMYTFNRVMDGLRNELRREPTTAEMAKAMKMSTQEFEYAVLMASSRPTSLDSALTEDGGNWLDILGTGTADEHLGAVDLSMQSTQLLDEIRMLQPEQFDAVIRYYGLMGHQARSMTELAREIGVTREAIRQRLLRAERILKFRLCSSNRIGVMPVAV